MKRGFTVRLPVRAGADARHAIRERAITDRVIMSHVLNDLIDSEQPTSSPELMGLAHQSLHDYARVHHGDEEWVSDHIAAAHRALLEYRTAYRSITHEKQEPTANRLRGLLSEHFEERPGVHAFIDRKSALGEDWDVVAHALLDLIRTGQGSLSFSVRSIGDIEVRGAGKRDLGDDISIPHLRLETRGDRFYLTVVVSHRIPGEKPSLNRDYGGVLHVALTPSIVAADDAGVCASEMVDEGRSLVELVSRARERPLPPARQRKVSRRIMDARHNYVRQYAVRVSEYAQRNNLAVEVSYFDEATGHHPRVAGMTRSLRRRLHGELFEQCHRRGVVFLSSRDMGRADYRTCGHEHRTLAVGVLSGSTVIAACSDCARKTVVD
jgi:hypothetical protein